MLLPDTPYSLEHLESLYNALHSSPLAVPGTLTLVRGARVPIIKYIDARGSGTPSLCKSCPANDKESKSMYP